MPGMEFESYEGAVWRRFEGSTGLRAWHAVRVLSGPPPSPTVPGVSWRRPNSAELAGFARSKLVSGPLLDGETPGCAALVSAQKIPFPGGCLIMEAVATRFVRILVSAETNDGQEVGA